MLRSSFIFNRDKLKHYDFMKHQQVVVDYTNMLNSSMTCVMLAFLGWVLIKLIQAIFTMPGYLKKENEREALEEQLKLDQQQMEAEDEQKKRAESEKSDEATEAAIGSDGKEPLLGASNLSKRKVAEDDDDDAVDDDDEDEDDEEFVESNGDVPTAEEKKIK